MLEARPRKWIGHAWDIYSHGKIVGELLPSFHMENARMRVGFRRYRIRRKRWSPGSWELHHSGKSILSAELTSRFRAQVEIRQGGHKLLMHPVGMLRDTFEVRTEKGKKIGSISRRSWLGRRVPFRLPEDMPREMQIFTFFLATVLWSRSVRFGAQSTFGA